MSIKRLIVTVLAVAVLVLPAIMAPAFAGTVSVDNSTYKQDLRNLFDVVKETLANRVYTYAEFGINATTNGKADCHYNNTLEYTIGNIMYAPVTNATVDLSGLSWNTTSAEGVQANRTSRIYAMVLDAAGNVNVTAGTAVTYGGTTAPEFPTYNPNHAIFAAFQVDATNTTFTLGTTRFTVDNNTVTKFNLSAPYLRRIVE